MKKKVAWGLACCLLLGLIGCQKEQGSSEPVSYTHLDVYKRQGRACLR